MPNNNTISVPVQVTGHCTITDDLGNTLLDKDNAIHPQNMARIISRAFANEHNSFVHRVAFGNGGTLVDAAYTITYRDPNDGQTPDTTGWESRLYHETFSKIIDDGQNGLNPLLGVDPGSADMNTGVRSGGGSVPSSDPTTIPHISGPGVRSVDYGLISEVVINVTLNADEPKGQYLTDTLSPTSTTEGSFVFDEIGLYTSGASAIDSSGYQYINIGNRLSTNDTGLVKNTTYSFAIAVDNGVPSIISFTTPALGGTGTNGEILYGDLCQAINTGDTAWGFLGSNPLPGGAKISITDQTAGVFPSITGAVTFGFLQFTSNSSGANSKILLDDPSWASHETITSLLPNINVPLGGTLEPSVSGATAGLQNAPTNPQTERERLLAHLIFSPILKSANRALNIVYTLTVSVGRTPR
ncbi:MAG: hypothetical protein ACXW2E_00805 [Nitrososphaeraceae archaeon]